MKNLDRHPEDLPVIAELYDASSFCVLGGGMSTTMGSTLSQVAPALLQHLPTVAPTIFGTMGSSPTPSPQAPVAPSIAPPFAQVPTSDPNQPLPFAPGLRPEDFSTMLANTIAEKLGAVFAANRSMPSRDRAPPTGGACLFCGQPNHYARNCDIAARYVNENRCKRDLQGRFIMPDGAFIRRGPGETFQQFVDRTPPARLSAMLELVSPQVNAASSYISSLISPTAVAMHTIEDTHDESEDEEEEDQRARCEEDLEDLSPEQLQLMVRTLNMQLRRSTRPATKTTRAPYPKKATEAPVPSVPIPAVPALPAAAPVPSTSTNLPPAQPPAPIVAPVTTAIPQPYKARPCGWDQKTKDKDASAPDFHYQCPIEDKADAKKVYQRILDLPVAVTARELLSLSPDVRRQAKESTTTKKIKAAAFIAINPVSNFLQALDARDCHEGLVVAKESHALRSIIPIVDGSLAIECILDSGCQIVGMSHAVWSKLEKELNPNHTVTMQSANGSVDRSLGIVENLSFRFGTIEVQLQVHVINDPAYDILLGRPFDVVTESIIKNFRNEDQQITITDPNNARHVATMQTHPRGPPRIHGEKKREGF
jgi:hypothetical protein